LRAKKKLARQRQTREAGAENYDIIVALQISDSLWCKDSLCGQNRKVVPLQKIGAVDYASREASGTSAHRVLTKIKVLFATQVDCFRTTLTERPKCLGQAILRKQCPHGSFATNVAWKPR